MKAYIAINKAPLQITNKHTGKMTGIWSISTSVLENAHCRARFENNVGICSKCFAKRQFSYRKNMRECYQKNTELLTSEVYPVENMPSLNCPYFRFEAFGDLNNEIQVENYFNICLKNPKVKFSMFTKNPLYISRVLKKRSKPDNLSIVLSTVSINDPLDPDRIKKVLPFVDHVFSVFDKKFAKVNDIKINCSALSCFGCHKCYEKDTEYEIYELSH